MLTQKDLAQLQAKGIRPEVISKQLDQFQKGFPFIRLVRPATPGDGLISLPDRERAYFQNYFDSNSGNVSIVKFVPASGAATRMFKHLFEFLVVAGNVPEKEKILKETGNGSVHQFLENLRHFAFYEDLHNLLQNDGKRLDMLLSSKDYTPIIEYLLTDKGLNYANLPKALLAFHQYVSGYRVAAEEHLAEAAHYAVDKHRNANVHFTVSPEHIRKFDERISAVKEKYEKEFNVNLIITHSIQKSSTDTLAVDEDNRPFRNPDGSLLFRPAGHGALLDNLNDLKADIVFIKNIDNIVPDRLKGPTYEYKKVIGGYLLEMRSIIFDFLRKSDTLASNEEEINAMLELAEKRFNISIPEKLHSSDTITKKKFLMNKLNRPMRVCGMVKNSGEPGGGPFWVADDNSANSLQIVESSQINLKDKEQSGIFCSSTHFNPVDLVCCIRDYRGNVFDLHRFVDESTGFISLKSSGGRNLKAMELPGLWNGSMSDWITVFVEVPLITFNPVKTVNDLLRNEHQMTAYAENN
jgi:hypothetical protein